MKTFEEATQFFGTKKITPESAARTKDLFERHKSLMEEVMASERVAALCVQGLVYALNCDPREVMPQSVFDELLLYAADVFFTGMVVGIEMEKP